MQVTPVSNLYSTPANIRRNAFETGSAPSREASFRVGRESDNHPGIQQDHGGVAPLAYSPTIFTLTGAGNQTVSQATGAAIYRNASQREGGRSVGHQFAASA